MCWESADSNGCVCQTAGHLRGCICSPLGMAGTGIDQSDTDNLSRVGTGSSAAVSSSQRFSLCFHPIYLLEKAHPQMARGWESEQIGVVKAAF